MTQRYRYRASNVDGRVVEGIVQANSQRAALADLRRQRLYPVDVAEIVAARSSSRRSSVGRTPALAIFARTVATMLAAGVALERAITFAGEHSANAELVRAVREVRKSVQAGAGFAEALAHQPRIFSPLFVAMAAAGEDSGNLDAGMASLANHLEQQVELRSQIRSSLLYPALMAVASGTGVTVLLMFVVPRFADMLVEEGGRLPLSTRLLIGTSHLVVQWWWLIVAAVLGLMIALRSWLAHSNNIRRWHAARLSWPLYGDLEIKYSTARFTRAFGMLLRSGRPVVSSLLAARATVSNAALAAGMERAAQAVSEGEPVHVALTGTLPPLATEMIAVGEESARLDDFCLRIAETYDDEVRRALRTLVAVIEPTLILLFGLIVGFVALAMLQAIYGINRSTL